LHGSDEIVEFRLIGADRVEASERSINILWGDVDVIRGRARSLDRRPRDIRIDSDAQLDGITTGAVAVTARAFSHLEIESSNSL
jgi:hypothetical protein